MVTKKMERLVEGVAPTMLIQLRPENPEQSVPPAGAGLALEGQVGEESESLGLGQERVEPPAGTAQVERAKHVQPEDGIQVSPG
jgi:hypothetical protein